MYVVNNLVSQEEEKILLALGYMVIRWNYAEYQVRQLLRRDSGVKSMLDRDSIQISNLVASALSSRLSDLAKRWSGREGEPYIKCLDEAFKMAVDHRNHLVHGTWMTVSHGDPKTASAVMIPSKIKNTRLEEPSQVPAEEFESKARYFHELAMFARTVLVGFDVDGARAVDGEGRPLIARLLPLIEPLPLVERTYLDE